MSLLKEATLTAALAALPWSALSSPASPTAASRPTTTCAAPSVPLDYLVYHALATSPVMPRAASRSPLACTPRSGVRT